jgi:ribonuclease BN (tRNA processing enzyme)
MGDKHLIKYYPVDNADTSLIKLSDDTTIQIDCQIKEDEENSDGVKIYDVKKDILEELQKDSNSNPYLDLFVLSHPHKDHCIGFEGNYYCGDPDDYSDVDRENDKIIIGELWVTRMIFGNDICEEAKAVRREAKRRRKLFKESQIESNKHGNRIRIIGYSEDDEIIEGLHSAPGSTIKTINGKYSDYASFFIHAPFKSDLVSNSAIKDHNATSIVFQISFRTSIGGEIKSRAFFSGDADHYIWEKIKNISEEKGNADKLKWNLFLAPHHCSWSFFNDRPYEDNKEPKDYSLEILDYKEKNAHVIASSKKIKNEEPNPPHFAAKEEYVKKVGEGYFRNTAVNVDENAPEPLKFEINDTGIKLLKAAGSVGSVIISKPTPRAG